MTTPDVALPNFHKVTDTLYRGAQPTAIGLVDLELDHGIHTVVNLRHFHCDLWMSEPNTMGYFSIPMDTWHVERADAALFLRIATGERTTPVFVHCAHGSDRTGTMVALYRICVMGWSKDQAIEEMVEGGFGFHGIWQNLKLFINRMDTDKLRQEAGL